MAKKISLMLSDDALVRLRVWGAMQAVELAKTASACIRNGLRVMAAAEGPGFAARFRANCEAAGLHLDSAGEFGEAEPAGPPAPESPEVSSGPRRLTGWRLEPEASQALRIYSAMAGRTMSDLADVAIRSHLCRLVASCGDEFGRAFEAAADLASGCGGGDDE